LITVPGGKPVTALPGLTPRSPEMIDGPVLVTVEPASTAKDDAVPNPTAGVAADADGITPTVTAMTIAVAAVRVPRTAAPHRGR
jgi:hypothetical protein